MTKAAADRVDGRTDDVIALPRSRTVHEWMDVQAAAFEVRRHLGRALVDHHRGISPIARLFDADRQLVRLHEFARRKAGEAEGITYISPDQVSLWDGCLDDPDDPQRGA